MIAVYSGSKSYWITGVLCISASFYINNGIVREVICSPEVVFPHNKADFYYDFTGKKQQTVLPIGSTNISPPSLVKCKKLRAVWSHIVYSRQYSLAPLDEGLQTLTTWETATLTSMNHEVNWADGCHYSSVMPLHDKKITHKGGSNTLRDD